MYYRFVIAFILFFSSAAVIVSATPACRGLSAESIEYKLTKRQELDGSEGSSKSEYRKGGIISGIFDSVFGRREDPPQQPYVKPPGP